MEYGANILSKQPADWIVLDGTMSSTSIELAAGGSATIEVLPQDLKAIPNSLLLFILADTFMNTYKFNLACFISVTMASGSTVEYTIPIEETSQGFSRVEIPVEAGTYLKMTFSIRTKYSVLISDWSLSAPIEKEAEIDLDEIKEEIPKILHDFNTSVIQVGQLETTIGLISAKLLENTDVNGHLLLTYVASEDCIVTLRAKDNNGVELFAPILYNVHSGRGSIGVPHAYLKRKIGIHTFSITAQCSTGTLTMYTRGVLYTIDAGHLAKRTLDVGVYVQDIAVQQLPGEEQPSHIYAIGIDDDSVARVRFRKYSEDGAVVWEPAFSVEPAILAAIEFDGDFVRRPGDALYTFESAPTPYVFWVDKAKDLFVRLGSDVATTQLLASNVSSLSVVRGYKSVFYADQDQGLIVAYVVDGVAKYRNYCRTADNTYTWNYEKSLEQLGSNVLSVQAHRLNDYRVGFVASTQSGTKWLISSRTYIGTSFPAEVVKFSISMKSSLAIFSSDSSSYPKPVITTSFSEDHVHLYVDSDHTLLMRSSFYDVFRVESTSSISVKHASSTGNRIDIELFEPVRSAIIKLHPQPEQLVAFYPNSGYVAFNDTILIEVVMRANTSETIEIRPSLACSMSQKAITTTYTAYSDAVLLKPSMTCQCVQIATKEKETICVERIEFKPSLSIDTLTQIFTGESPV